MTNIVKYNQLCSIWIFEQYTATDVFVVSNLNLFYIPMQTYDFVNSVQDLQSSVDSKSTDSKILSSGSLGDSFLATCAL